MEQHKTHKEQHQQKKSNAKTKQGINKNNRDSS